MIGYCAVVRPTIKANGTKKVMPSSSIVAVGSCESLSEVARRPDFLVVTKMAIATEPKNTIEGTSACAAM